MELLQNAQESPVADETTFQFLLTALVKLSGRFRNSASRERILEWLEDFTTDASVELQQRAVEYSILARQSPELLEKVVAQFPPLPPREQVRDIHDWILDSEAEDDEEEENDEDEDETDESSESSSEDDDGDDGDADTSKTDPLDILGMGSEMLQAQQTGRLASPPKPKRSPPSPHQQQQQQRKEKDDGSRTGGGSEFDILDDIFGGSNAADGAAGPTSPSSPASVVDFFDMDGLSSALPSSSSPPAEGVLMVEEKGLKVEAFFDPPQVSPFIPFHFILHSHL